MLRDQRQAIAGKALCCRMYAIDLMNVSQALTGYEKEIFSSSSIHMSGLKTKGESSKVSFRSFFHRLFESLLFHYGGPSIIAVRLS